MISLFVRGTDKVIYKYIKYFVPDGQRGKGRGAKAHALLLPFPVR